MTAEKIKGSKRKRSAKSSTKARIECFMAAISDLNPKWMQGNKRWVH